jgi:hypothetical protein
VIGAAGLGESALTLSYRVSLSFVRDCRRGHAGSVAAAVHGGLPGVHRPDHGKDVRARELHRQQAQRGGGRAPVITRRIARPPKFSIVVHMVAADL